MKKLYCCLAAFLLFASCAKNNTPIAESKLPPEQQKHSIRILAKATGWQPTIYLIEVDGQRYVAVSGCGIAKER